MKNIADLMKQAGQMQARLEAMQRELAEAEYEGRAGAGLVQVTMNGRNEVTAVRIDPAALVPSEAAVLEDLLVAAFADAKSRVEARQQEEMSKLTGGLNLPGGFKLPF